MLSRNHKAEGAYLVVIWSQVTQCSGWSLITWTSRNAKSWSPLNHMCLLSRGPHRETLISPICLRWYDVQEAESVGMSERCSAPLKQRSLQAKNTDDTDATFALEVIRYIFRHLGAPYLSRPNCSLPTAQASPSFSSSAMVVNTSGQSKRASKESNARRRAALARNRRPCWSCQRDRQKVSVMLQTTGSCSLRSQCTQMTNSFCERCVKKGRNCEPGLPPKGKVHTVSSQSEGRSP